MALSSRLVFETVPEIKCPPNTKFLAWQGNVAFVSELKEKNRNKNLRYSKTEGQVCVVASLRKSSGLVKLWWHWLSSVT